jgi:hypothetical protein
MMPAIPIVPWSSAPPPVPPRTFSTEPPPVSGAPPSEPTLVRHEPIDARAFMIGDPQRAEEIRDEARGLVHQALEEALAPLHFRVNELERRLETHERNARAAAAASPPPPQVAPRAAPPAPPPMAYAPLVPAPAPMAYPPLAPAPMAMAPMAPAGYAPADPYVGAVALPRPPAISTFDDDLPFDGARRKRNVLVFFGILFVLVVGGLLASMAMSYSSPH